MELIIETKNKTIAKKLQESYEIAMNETNRKDFIAKFKSLMDVEMGSGANHIWISMEYIRVAIIFNPFK